MKTLKRDFGKEPPTLTHVDMMLSPLSDNVSVVTLARQRQVVKCCHPVHDQMSWAKRLLLCMSAM